MSSSSHVHDRCVHCENRNLFNADLREELKCVLEALENLVGACNENHNGHDNSICSVCTYSALAELAIRKARGEEDA